MSRQSASVESLTALLHNHYDPLRRRAERLAARASSQIHEHTDSGGVCQFSERFLQILWNEQRLQPALRTVEGDLVEVVTPGTWNVEAGPDFRNAALRINGRLRKGAVEIHRREGEWEQHGHSRDPAYHGVVLHAVWEAGRVRAPNRPPCVVLADHLDRPWQSLLKELSAAAYPYAKQVSPGACAVRWALTEDEHVVRILQVAGLARFEDKALRLQRRSVAVGAGQALYEAVFEGLGYKANREPFRELSRGISLKTLRASGDPSACEGLLFGAAGLLPDPSVEPVLGAWRERVRVLWDSWWSSGISPLGLSWSRGRSRPFNSPERRLAAGIKWLQGTAFAPSEWLLAVAERADSARGLVRHLEESFVFESPWECCKNFSAALNRPGRLVGTARVRDLLVNVLLPFLQGTVTGGCAPPRLGRLAKEAYLQMPGLQTNRMLREAAHRFLVPPSRLHTLVRKAAVQQGLLEVYRTFCLALQGDCANCPFADMAGVDRKQLEQ